MNHIFFVRVLLAGWFLLQSWDAAVAAATRRTNEEDVLPHEGNSQHHNETKERFPSGNNHGDVFDSCITSADCAFNGECVKDNRSLARLNHNESHGYSETSNGVSDTNIPDDPEAPGVCHCFDGWKGNTCEVLDLLPVDPERVGLVLPNHNSSTWGGSVVYHEDDGLYHMFASEILYNCGLYSWTTNSQVIRAVSKSPYGPYKKVQVILPPFSHDANIIRAPTGEFVLYVTALRGVRPMDCRNQTAQNNGTPPLFQTRARYLRNSFTTTRETFVGSEDDNVPPKDTYMLWANRPEGPWSEPVMVLNSTIYNSDFWKKHNKTAKCDSNLNGIILPSSSKDDDKDGGRQPFLGLWRRCETENLLTIPHALVASDWKNATSYQPIVDHPLFVLAGSGAEDPSNIWTTQTSDMEDGQVAYHAIFHDEQATRCMLGACGGQGRHAVSLDGTTWKYASVNAYERHVSWKPPGVVENQKHHSNSNSNNNSISIQRNGTVRADTRARPHVVLAPTNQQQGSKNPAHQTPIALSTGLKETDESGYVYTLVQPLRSSTTTNSSTSTISPFDNKIE